jgi:hypothetical protein
MNNISKFIGSFLIILLSFSPAHTQIHSQKYYSEKTNMMMEGFLNALVYESIWGTYESRIGDLLKEMEVDLSSGSGLSFEEMNEVRVYQSILNRIKDFGNGIATGGFWKIFNGRMLKRIKEVFPEITIESLKSSPCISIFRIRYMKYVVLAARHNDKGVMREIKWWDNSKGCKTLGGSFTVYPGVFRTFWHNNTCPENTGSNVVITSCSFKMQWGEFGEPIESFKDN